MRFYAKPIPIRRKLAMPQSQNLDSACPFTWRE